jgi:cysteine-rich repeat protein
MADESSTSGVDTSSSDDGGVHTVTGYEPATDDSGTTTTPADPETSADATSSSTTADTGETSDTDTTGQDNPKQCGNGIVEGDELCDDGNQDNTDTCTVQCKTPTCGDALPGPDEVCDDGNDLDNDECLSTCKAAYCGDGAVWDGEEDCDDANPLETDACLPTCKAAKCGDGKVWAGHEVCDDGFNDNSYNGCKMGCASKSDTYCGDSKVQATYEHCDGATGMSNVGCDSCLFDFSQITQMSCAGSCSWGAVQGCGQDDADIFCKLLTGNASAKALTWKLAAPTDAGGFPCSDPGVFINLNGSDPRKWLGTLPQFGVAKNVAWQATKIKTTHGSSSVLQANDVVCDG